MRIQQAIKKCKCEDCGEIFDEDEAIYETHRLFTGMYGGVYEDHCGYKDETYMYCPCCHSDCISDYYEDDEDETDGE